MGPEQALEKRDGAVLTRVAGIPGGLGTVYYLEGTKRWLGGPIPWSWLSLLVVTLENPDQ